MRIYVIMKNGKYVKDFTEGQELTRSYNLAEKYTSLKAAQIAASQYGRKYGKGYSAFEA